MTRWHISLAIVLAAFGLLVSIQWRSQQTIGTSGQDGRADASASTIQQLENEQRTLKSTVADLQHKIQVAQQEDKTAGNLNGLQKELDRQRMLAGLIALKGPGVKVVLDDSTRNPLPDDNPNNYIIHDFELRDTINLLWSGGAEAIALNGERITSVTSVFCVGTTILVNDTRMSPPYEITAIGNAGQLENLVNQPTSLRDLKTSARLYGVQLKVTQGKEVLIPAYDGAFNLRHATVGGN